MPTKQLIEREKFEKRKKEREGETKIDKKREKRRKMVTKTQQRRTERRKDRRDFHHSDAKCRLIMNKPQSPFKMGIQLFLSKQLVSWGSVARGGYGASCPR